MVSMKILNPSFDVEEGRRGGCIRSVTGRRLWPLDMRPDDFDPFDIAHSLSQICRFTGHSREFISVAQHCCTVSDKIEDQRFARWGLVHDAPEYVVSDLNSIVKHSGLLENYRDIEHAIVLPMCEWLGLSAFEPPEVKEADRRSFATEVRDFMVSLEGQMWTELAGIEPYPEQLVSWSPRRARDEWLTRFRRLFPDQWSTFYSTCSFRSDLPA